METPELPGPLLREWKVEAGSVPTARCPGPGSSTDTSKCSSTRSPSPCAPACQTGQRATDSTSLEEREPLSVLGSRVAATGFRVRTPGRGPKAVVELWSLRALAALPARRLWVSTWRRGAASGSADATWAPSMRARGSGTGGAAKECEIGADRCAGLSALGMRAGDGGTQFGDPLRWPLAGVFRWDSLLFPKAFWRISYKRLKFMFTFSVFRLYWLTVTNSLNASRRVISDMITPKQSFK